MTTMTALARIAGVLACFVVFGGCDAAPSRPAADQTAEVDQPAAVAARLPYATPRVNRDWQSPDLAFGLRLSAAAEERATHAVVYDAAYQRIPYPGGDVAPDRGVCSDEIVRAYRLLGIDLQKLVHEDMRRAFGAYPKRWGLNAPDTNIDHRRVPNLATYFGRHGTSLPISQNGDHYKPGDVVAWALADGRPHIGMVTERRSSDGKRPLVMHNIGFGPQIEDMLFGLTITGHYRYHHQAGSARPS
jgi:uncharacterized protein YijF (DUF1287 family)